VEAHDEALGLGPSGKGYPLGTWRFDVAGNADVSVYLPRTTAVDFTTQFIVKGQDLTIESIPICPGKTGRYTWQASAKELTLTVVDDDACAARARSSAARGRAAAEDDSS
jgi:hypothetical protein